MEKNRKPNGKFETNRQGREVFSLLKNPHRLLGKVYKNITLTNEQGEKGDWREFVTFPKEVYDALRGSEIMPDDFLEELGVNPDLINTSVQGLLCDKLGTLDDPAFRYQEDDFNLYILNGLTNEHTLAMTQYATQNFNDPEVRAPYQQHMHDAVAGSLNNHLAQDMRASLIFRDDCMASVVSLAGLVEKMLDASQEENIKRGVLVQIDGPVTAQAILLAKAFKNLFDFPLTIVGSHWAGGLTEGKINDKGIIEHANYITYPKKLLKKLNPEVRALLERCKNEKGIIQVVGDMGEAEKGIEDSVVKKLREKFGPTFCIWNDSRTDSHGEHPNKDKGLRHIVQESSLGLPKRYYPARGALLSLELDLENNPNLLKEFSIVVERASRINSQELGYGAAYKEF